MAREHDALLFMGQGAKSSQAVARLHRRVDEAFNLLSARQQGEEFTPKDAHDLDDLMKDLGAALLGREVNLGAKLPYPGKLR